MNILLLLTLLVAPSLGSHINYIIGGFEVTNATKYPFMVSLQKNAANVCGGAILSDRWIVTAAHCVAGQLDYAVTGRLSITDEGAGSPLFYKIMGTMRHEGFKPDERNGNPNDLALIKVASKIMLSDTAKAIAMAKDGDDFMNCAIMGWGHVDTGIFPKPTPDRLQEAAVNIFSPEFCKGRWSESQISENHICAGVDGTAGACSSDGGGPLACEVNGEKRLAGVMSFTSFRCTPNKPTVFTRISKYTAWINDFIL